MDAARRHHEAQRLADRRAMEEEIRLLEEEAEEAEVEEARYDQAQRVFAERGRDLQEYMDDETFQRFLQ